ncbi:MAG: hypothetical protein A3J24_08450, partial [Deltaproteobacteria bacterium RIFCSPLOWO2_02_FULL_53_8]
DSNGTASGNAAFTTSAKLGSHAGVFDGTGDFVNVGTLPTFSTTTFSAEAWIKTSTSKAILGRWSDSSGSNQQFIFLVADGKIRIYLEDNAGLSDWSFGGSRNVIDGTWHHVAMTFNAGVVALYVDGVLDASTTAPGGSVADKSSQAVLIGTYHASETSNHFSGSMDEVAIYNRTLTASEIAIHAGLGYPVSGTNTFVSQAFDSGGPSINWASLSWNEDAMGYGEALSTGPTPAAVSTETPGLVSLWKMDWNWTDSKGANNGTGVGDATFDTTTKKVGDSAGRFSWTGSAVTSTHDYITVTDSNSIDLSGNATLELWMKLASLPSVSGLGDAELLFKRNGSGTNYQLYVGAADNVLKFYNGTSAVSSGWTVPDNGWHHIVLTRTETNSMTFYVDGVMKTTVASDWGSYLGSNLYIGADGGTVGGYWSAGYLDEVAIYNRALLAGEIRQHYMDQVGNYGLVGLWHLDGALGAVSTAAGAVTGAVGGNGTAFGNPTYDTGKFNQAINFDGTEDHVLMGASVPAGLQLKNELSLEAWIYATTCPTDALHAIVGCQRDTSTGGYGIHLDCRLNPNPHTAPRSHIHFQIGDGGWHTTDVNAEVPLNQWVHIVATRRANENAKVYYNGVPQPLTSVSWTGDITYTNATFAIGRQTEYSDRIFTGKIDEVAVWSRALSAEEVADHYARGAANLKLNVSTSDDNLAWSAWSSDITQTPANLNVSASRYIKYKATLSTDDYAITPKFQGGAMGYNSYPSDEPYVIPGTGQAYVGYLTSFAQTLGAGNQGEVRYQVSADDGASWKYWDGAAWSAATLGYSHAGTAATINTNIASVYETLGAGTLKFKAFLSSDGTQAVELDTVDLGYSAGRVTVTDPDGAEEWLAGASSDITWTSAGTVSGNLTLQYSTNSGSTWTDIAAGEANDGTYPWNVPTAAAGTTIRVKIVDGSDSSIHDTSNADFTVLNPTTSYTLTAPADITAGGSRAPYTVTRNNASGVATAGNETVYLYTSSDGANAKFYDAAENGNIITSVTIANTAASATFYYYDEKSGSFTITASDATPTADGNTGID